MGLRAPTEANTRNSNLGLLVVGVKRRAPQIDFAVLEPACDSLCTLHSGKPYQLFFKRGGPLAFLLGDVAFSPHF